MSTEENIALLFKDLTSPETNVVFQTQPRANADVIKTTINPAKESNLSPFELSTGAADADSYHDFFRLQIAFEEVWAELFDTGILQQGQWMYGYWDALMQFAEPPQIAPSQISSVADLQEFIDFLKNQYGLDSTAGPQSSPLLAQLAGAVANTLESAFDSWVIAAKPNDFLPVQLLDGSSPVFKDYKKIVSDQIAALRAAASTVAKNEAVTNAPKLSELQALLTKLESMLSEKYRFDVFAPNSVNYGLLLNYRQHWVPLSYQVGNLVSTIPLAPQEVRRYTTKTVVKRSRNVKEIDDALRTTKDEQAETSRMDSEIVQRAKQQTNFQMNAQENFGNDNLYKISAGQQTGQDQSVESAQTKREFRESVVKSAQEYRNEHRIEITTEESTEDETTTFREIRNPNDELTVTYLFYELQRRYEVDEQLHKVTPVILVANEVPAPNEVDQAWLLRYDWILKRTLLDKSFDPALDYLSTNLTGAEVNLKVLQLAVEDQRAVVAKISQQVSVANDALNAAGLRLQGVEADEVGALRTRETGSLIKSFFDPLGVTQTGNVDGNADRAAVDFAKDALDRAQATASRLQGQLRVETTALQVAVDKFTKASAEHFSMLTAIDRLRVHVKDNIIYYMQAIWTYEPTDQRFFRLYNIDVPVFTHNTTIGAVQSDSGIAALDTSRNTFDLNLPTPELDVDGTLKLHQVADIENLIGFKGNYMIFPLVNFNYMTWFMMQDYLAVDENGVVARDPDEAGSLTVQELQAALQDFKKIKGPQQFDAMAPKFQQVMEQLLSRGKPDMVIVPSNSLYIEALPGTHPLLEDFKLIHRAVDVKKAQADTRHAELENLRLAARLENKEHSDPDIDKLVVVADGKNVTVDA